MSVHRQFREFFVRRRVTQGAALALSGWLLVACSSGGSPTVESVPSVVSSSSATSSSAAPSSSAVSSPTSSPTSSSASAPLFSSAAPTTAPPTSDAIPATEAADRAAVEAQYTKYWEVYAALPHTPEDQWDGLLGAVAVEPVLSNAKKDARTIMGKGRDTYGTVVHRYSWPKSIDGSDTATISDCDDTSQSGAYETATGNKVTVGVPRRHMVGSMIRGADGIWRIQQSYWLADDPC